MLLVVINSGSSKALEHLGDLAAGVNRQDLLTHVSMQPGASPRLCSRVKLLPCLIFSPLIQEGCC